MGSNLKADAIFLFTLLSNVMRHLLHPLDGTTTSPSEESDFTPFSVQVSKMSSSRVSSKIHEMFNDLSKNEEQKTEKHFPPNVNNNSVCFQQLDSYTYLGPSGSSLPCESFYKRFRWLPRHFLPISRLCCNLLYYPQTSSAAWCDMSEQEGAVDVVSGVRTRWLHCSDETINALVVRQDDKEGKGGDLIWEHT